MVRRESSRKNIGSTDSMGIRLLSSRSWSHDNEKLRASMKKGLIELKAMSKFLNVGSFGGLRYGA